jgi:hypothetical protein
MNMNVLWSEFYLGQARINSVEMEPKLFCHIGSRHQNNFSGSDFLDKIICAVYKSLNLSLKHIYFLRKAYPTSPDASHYVQ